MQKEKDLYYEKLPFQLPQQQADPQYVILGTGLQQCLISAHLTKINSQRGLVIDLQKSYGSALKTVTIKELHSLNNNQQQFAKLYQFKTPSQCKIKNQQFYNQIVKNNNHRGYNIDIQPNLFFASSITCQLLKQAQMDKYMDFRLVYNMLYLDKGKFCQVPLSKGKIFSTKTLSLVQKKLLLSVLHQIIQIYNKYHNIQENQNSTQQFDKNFGQVDQKAYKQFMEAIDKPFIQILKKKTKNNKKIMNYLTYIICNYQYNYDKDIPKHAFKDYTVKGFLDRFGKFVKSCGIYGQGPYLYVDNGIGDIPQAYCRIASVFGTTYILHPKITLNIKTILSEQSQNKQGYVQIETNLIKNRPIKTKKVYYGPTFFDLKEQNKENYFTQKLLRISLLCNKLGTQQECPAIGYILDAQGFQNPIYLFLFDESSHTCPKNYIFYHFQTIISHQKESYQEQLKQLIKICSQAKGQEFQNSIKYTSVYIRTRLYPKIVQVESHQTQTKKQQIREIFLKDNYGIDLDGHFINFKEIVGQKQHYFRKPGQNSPKDDDQDEYFGDDTQHLLNRLHGLKVPTDPTQVKKVQQKEIDQQQQQEQEQKEESQPEIKQIQQQSKSQKDQNKQIKSSNQKQQSQQVIDQQNQNDRNQEKIQQPN